MRKNTSTDVKGRSSLTLALYLKMKAEIARSLRDPEFGKPVHLNWLVSVGGEYTRQLKQNGPDPFLEEAESLLGRTIKEYGGSRYNDRPLREVAENELFELRHLSVGKVAPDIEGEDIDGQKFKLSDLSRQGGRS
jgi:hypothetical protein